MKSKKSNSYPQFFCPIARFLVLLFTNSALFAQASEFEKFDLVKEDSPVFIYERWITFPGKVPAVKAREVKSEFIIYATIPELLAILQDESQIKSWQTHVAESKVFPVRHYLLVRVFIPRHTLARKRSGSFSKIRIDSENSREKIFIAFQSASNPKLAPLKSGVARMELAGSWLFEQITPTQAKVTYRILSMPSNIPRMFTDPVVRSNLLSTIKALTKLVEEKN
ncbi:MAG: hypothetical protein U5K54_06960 [Cytophagales bacterium]|nr:hypothetical protein [Cytophagales bacterium]